MKLVKQALVACVLVAMPVGAYAQTDCGYTISEIMYEAVSDPNYRPVGYALETQINWAQGFAETATTPNVDVATWNGCVIALTMTERYGHSGLTVKVIQDPDTQRFYAVVNPQITEGADVAYRDRMLEIVDAALGQ